MGTSAVNGKAVQGQQPGGKPDGVSTYERWRHNAGEVAARVGDAANPRKVLVRQVHDRLFAPWGGASPEPPRPHKPLW